MDYERYDDLRSFHSLMRSVAHIVYQIALVLLVLLVIVGILAGGYTIIESIYWDDFAYLWNGVLTIVFSILGGALGYVVLFYLTLFVHASLNLIDVFMDIEDNTRDTANNTRDTAKNTHELLTQSKRRNKSW